MQKSNQTYIWIQTFLRSSIYVYYIWQLMANLKHVNSNTHCLINVISRCKVGDPRAGHLPWIVMVLGEGLIWLNFLPSSSHVIVTGFGGPTASQVNVKELFLVTFTSPGCLIKVGKPALRKPDTLRLVYKLTNIRTFCENNRGLTSNLNNDGIWLNHFVTDTQSALVLTSVSPLNALKPATNQDHSQSHIDSTAPLKQRSTIAKFYTFKPKYKIYLAHLTYVFVLIFKYASQKKMFAKHC